MRQLSGGLVFRFLVLCFSTFLVLGCSHFKGSSPEAADSSFDQSSEFPKFSRLRQDLEEIQISPQKTHRIYLEGTPNQLDVYTIEGLKPGKTLLVIRGIHGNEPGGYLAADRFVDINLLKGRMIIVPRANLETIRANHRGLYGDMNRKFPSAHDHDQDGRVIDVLKDLIGKSDAMLNLHDGSGYFYPKWVSGSRNPKKFGQSVIIDRDKWVSKNGEVIELRKMAERVAERVNQDISIPLHQFHVNNTNTALQTSNHPDMKYTATYYALSHLDMPAYGVETSKSLPNDALKATYQTLVINAFMAELGIETGVPLVQPDRPKLTYIIMNVDGVNRVVYPQQTVEIEKGSEISILDIKSNYKRGLFFRMNGIDDFQLKDKVQVMESGDLQVRKDAYLTGKIHLAVIDKPQELPTELSSEGKGSEEVAADVDENLPKNLAHSSKYNKSGIYLIYSRNGQRLVTPVGSHIQLLEGDYLILESISSKEPLKGKSYKVNLEGFIGNTKYNNGEDRGYLVKTDTGLMSRWAKSGPNKTKLYDVVISENDKEVGRVQVQVKEPHFHFAVLEGEDGEKHFINKAVKEPKPVRIDGKQFKISSVQVPGGDIGRIRVVLDKSPLPFREGSWWGNLNLKKQGSLQIFYGDRVLEETKLTPSTSQVGR